MIPELDETIEVVRAHLDVTGTHGTEIEAILVRYLLALIYAKYESFLHRQLEQRFASAGDPEITTFASQALRNVMRGVKFGDLTGVLNKMSSSLGARFVELRLEWLEAEQAYTTIISNRIDFAHDKGTVQLTFNELCQQYHRSTWLLALFVKVLTRV